MHRTLFELLLFMGPAVMVALLMPWFIQALKQRALGQAIRQEGLEAHQKKSGTPTAGGVVFLGVSALWVVVLTWMQWLPGTDVVWWVVGVMLLMGAVGYWDDALKMAQKKNDGISGYVKLVVQVGLGLALGVYLLQAGHNPDGVTHLWGVFSLPLGWGFPIFCALVVVATSNAVNITDGADGLAASTLIICLLGFYSVFVGGGLLGLPNLVIPAAMPLALVSLIVMGTVFGFLLFNKKPARVFMGDTGSLALGGLVAALALVSGLEWWILCFGVLFVVEALSVVAQVASFKLTGKRILKMSPIHHHFELCGWSEQQIVRVFSLFQLLGVAVGICVYIYSLGHGSGTIAVF